MAILWKNVLFLHNGSLKKKTNKQEKQKRKEGREEKGREGKRREGGKESCTQLNNLCKLHVS